MKARAERDGSDGEVWTVATFVSYAPGHVPSSIVVFFVKVYPLFAPLKIQIG